MGASIFLFRNGSPCFPLKVKATLASSCEAKAHGTAMPAARARRGLCVRAGRALELAGAGSPGNSPAPASAGISPDRSRIQPLRSRHAACSDSHEGGMQTQRAVSLRRPRGGTSTHTAHSSTYGGVPGGLPSGTGGARGGASSHQVGLCPAPKQPGVPGSSFSNSNGGSR